MQHALVPNAMNARTMAAAATSPALLATFGAHDTNDRLCGYGGCLTQRLDSAPADVDGTLIHAIGPAANKLHKRAFSHAFKVTLCSLFLFSDRRGAPILTRSRMQRRTSLCIAACVTDSCGLRPECPLAFFSDHVPVPPNHHSQEVYGITASIDEIEVRPVSSCSMLKGQ